MEKCCVCDKSQAEWLCRQCEEYVCEDCTVGMTLHNQIDYTCCHNCRPDEPTIGDYNKPLKSKTMEYLNELKAGMQLEAAVLEAWCRPTQGKNMARTEGTWHSSTNVYGGIQPQPITEIRDNYFRIQNGSTASMGSLLFRRSGFIEFYNNFYDTLAQSQEISPFTPNFTVGQETKIWIGNNPELYMKVYQELIRLGCNDKNNIKSRRKLSIYTYREGCFGHTDDRDFFDRYDNYRLITVEDLFPPIRINTINYTQTTTIQNGNKIILRKSPPTITRGERPTGIAARSKTGRITTAVGHLSNRAISF